MWKSSFFLLLILLSFSIEIEFSKLRHLIELMEVGGGWEVFFFKSVSPQQQQQQQQQLKTTKKLDGGMASVSE